MWLLPFLTHFSSVASRSYYRLTVSGAPVPDQGPVLLVANHPNSLLDPALVVLAAGRPVRFLAKAPLFDQRSLGWLVRGSGAIPVYRPADDPSQVGRNQDSFRAVREALADGSAVGIFPEGLSHNEPSLAPLKTGAARVALETARELGGPFPIVPVGLTFRGKERFRSEALVLVGEPVPWRDVAGPEGDVPERVRELTRRMEGVLRQVTLNLERWEDGPVLAGAEEIRQLETGPRERNPARQFHQFQATHEAFHRLRAAEPHESVDRSLPRELARHLRLLSLLGLEPRDLHHQPSILVGMRSFLVQTGIFGLITPLALAGALVYGLPYQLVSRVERRLELGLDVQATFKVLGGGVTYLAWTLLLVGLIFWTAGWRWAVAGLIALPALGVVALSVHRRWREALADLRRFAFLRTRNDLRHRLLERQQELAQRLQALRDEAPAPVRSGAGTPDGRAGQPGRQARPSEHSARTGRRPS